MLNTTNRRRQAVERWLRTAGVARYDAYHNGGDAGRPAAEVFAELRARTRNKNRTPSYRAKKR